MLCATVAVPIVQAATAKPEITQQPVHHYGKVGTTATFTVETSTASPSYQWQYSADYGKTWKTYKGTGAKTNEISIKLTADNVETMYRCRVKDTVSGKSTYSDEVQTRTPVVATGSASGSASGNDGAERAYNVSWVLTQNGTLFLSGDGCVPIMQDAEWGNYSDMVKTIIIEYGFDSIGANAFRGYETLTKVVMADSILNIWSQAFMECPQLSDVTFSNNLTSIDDFAFWSCDFTSLSLPGSLVEIGDVAFGDCFDLTELTLPQSLTTIPDSCFQHCYSLERLTMGNKITAIGAQAFEGCFVLHTIEWSNSLETIGERAFYECHGITDLILPDSVTTIDSEAFCGDNIETVHLPDSLLYLHGFRMLSKVTEITIPENTLVLGKDTFESFASLKLVIFECDPPMISDYTFKDVTADMAYPKDLGTWTEYDFVSYQGNLTWKPYGQPIITKQPVHYYGKLGTTATFTVKTDIDTGFPIYQWEYSTDYGRTWQKYTGTGANTNKISFKMTTGNVENLYRCQITDGICGKTVLSDWAQARTSMIQSGAAEGMANQFDGRPGDPYDLEWVLTQNGTLFIEGTGTVPELSRFEDFVDIEWIKSVVVFPGITQIGYWAFENYPSLTRIDLADTVTDLNYAFNQCYNLSDITLSNNLKNITNSFSQAAISSIDIPDSVETVGEWAFYYCTNLKEITLKGNITSIGAYAFSKCYGLETIIMGDQLTTIGDNAFEDCFSVKTIEWSKNLQTIGAFAFYFDTATQIAHIMTELTLPDNVTSIGDSAFSGWVNLETVHLPDSLTSIGKNVFNGCNNLKSINIPANLAHINNSFSNHPNVTVITIPSSVITIGNGTFNGYSGLELIIFEGDPPLVATDTFSGVTAVVAYNKDLGTWTEADFVSYKGNLTWKPYGTPKFTTQPKNYTGKVGTKATFSVKTDIDKGWPSYQWQVSTDDGKTWTNYTGSGAKTKKISVTVTAENIGNMYRCVVTDGICEESTISKVAQIRTPVEITQQPVGMDAKLGGKYSATVTAVGKGLTYQWYVKDPAGTKFGKSSIQKASYSSTMKAATDGRQVYCVITDAFGNSVTTETITFRLIVTVTNQPDNRLVEEGKMASTTVEAVGNGLTYQWYTKNYGATKFSKSSITSATYTCKMTDASNGRQIYCIITDAYGNTVQTKTVKLYMPVKIYEQPKDQYTAYGSKASVSVNVRGMDLKYQWYYRNAGTEEFILSSVTSATYSVRMNKTTRNREVYCVITDALGNTVQTETIKLYVTATITQQPTDVRVSSGEAVKVTLSAVGDGLTYQWYVKNTWSESFTKSSITKATYTNTMNKYVHGRQVYCVITDKYGNSVQTETVTLHANVFIVNQPVTVSVFNAETASVSVSALGDGLTYQWYYANEGSDKFVLTNSFKGDTYTVTMNEARAGRRVYCVITDQYGNSVQTKTVTLKMNQTVKITQQPTDQYTPFGTKATVSIAASGDGLTYTWYYRNAGTTDFVKSSVTAATYSVKMNKTTRNREVYCVITDKYGNTVQTETIKLYVTATITQQPTDVRVSSGETVKVTFSAVGDGLTYQWYVKNVGSENFNKSSITKATYTTTMNKYVHGRQIYCVITDKYGNSVQTETVTLHANVFISNQPVSVTVAEGETAKVIVNAVGDDLTYQWYYANAGATKFSLTNSFKGNTYSVAMTDGRAGRRVYCVITDKYGNSVTTDVVTLGMTGKLVITQQPVSVTVAEGETAKVTVDVVGEGLTYQWYYAHEGSDKFILTNSFKGSTYSVAMNDARNGRRLYCVITDQYGNQITTEVVTISMK